MATGKSGYIDVAVMPQSVGKVRVYWREDYDTLNNNSTITITDIQGYLWHRNGWADIDVKVTAGDVTVMNSIDRWMFPAFADTTLRSVVPQSNSNGTFTPVTSAPIYHDNDGTKTIDITFTLVDCVIASVGFDAADNRSASSTVTLTPIPRASDLSTYNGTLGTAQTLTVDCKAPSYTHTITYACGSASGTVCTKSDSLSVPWTPPLELAWQNTTGTSVSVVLTIATYSGDTWIGAKSVTVPMAIPDSVGLTVAEGWATAAPYNTGTKAEQLPVYVQGYSRAQVTFDSSKISTADAYGATISSYEITHNGVSNAADHRTGVLQTAGAHSILCKVTDTRGRSVSTALTIAAEAYANPTLSEISVFRCSSLGEAQDDGTYLCVTAKGNISSVAGLNASAMRLSIGDLMTVEIPNGTPIVVGDGLVLSVLTYQAVLQLTDVLGNTAVYAQMIPTAQAFFHGRQGGRGAAFGKYAEADDLLDVDWNLRVRGDAQVDGVLDAA